MAAPTFVTSAASAWNTNGTPKTTPGITAQAGDLVVSLLADEQDNGTENYAWSSSAAATWTEHAESVGATTQDAFLQSARATLAGAWSGATVSAARSAGNSNLYGHVCSVWRNHGGVGNIGNSARISSSAPSYSFTTSAANSGLVVIAVDWNAADGAGRSYAAINGVTPTELAYFRASANYTVYAFRVADAGPAGAKTIQINGLAAAGRVLFHVVEILGTASGAPTGTASGSWSFAGSATGKRTPKGTASGSFSFTGSAPGKRNPQGTGSGSWTYSGTATGSTPTLSPNDGTAAGTWTFTGTASGATVRRGTATGTWTFATTATGQRTPKGSGGGTVAYAGAATGRTAKRGTATGTWTWAGSAVGDAPLPGMQEGSATGSWAYTGSASGRRSPVGTGTGTHAWTGTATGTTTRSGTAVGTWSLAGAAVGKRSPVATAAGTWTYVGTASGVGVVVRATITAVTADPPRFTVGAERARYAAIPDPPRREATP